MGLLDRYMGVPGADVFLPHSPPHALRARHPLWMPPGLSGLSSFDSGSLVKIEGIPRPTGRAPVNPDICYRIRIPLGARGTTATLEKMAEMAVEASQDPGFVQMARGVVRSCPSRDLLCEGDAVMRHVVERVRYTNDPAYLEYIGSPGWVYFVDGQEDCDGHSCLVSAIDVSVGRGCRYAAYKLDRTRPDEFSHVLCQLGVRTPQGVRWFGQDTIVPHPRLGFEPPESEWIGDPNYLVVVSP